MTTQRLVRALVCSFVLAGSGLLRPGDCFAEGTSGTVLTTKPALQPSPLKQQDIEALIKLLPIEQRNAVLNDQKAFKALAQQEAMNHAVLLAARANSFDKDPGVQTLMQRGADRVLADLYLNQIVRANLPKDFPAEQQTQDYYEKARDQFQTPERIHLWQVYLPIAKDTKPNDVAAVEKQAGELVMKLRRGREDFAAAVAEESRHEVSRLNGGYMGLLRMDELLPEVRAAVKGMNEGDISHPIKSEDGFHIIKRDAVVPARSLPYEEIKNDVRQLLIRDAIAQIRDGILKQIMSTYPVALDDGDIEQWRAALKAGAGAVGAAASTAGK